MPSNAPTKTTPRGSCRRNRIVPWLAVLVTLAGCGSEPARFRLNTEGRDPASISPAQREAIVDMLRDLFGTVDQPRVPDGVRLDPAMLRRAAGPVRSDEQGRDFGLYRKECVICHGLSGDGAGPTAAMQNPYPRDFRPGIFKYTSTAAGAKPTLDDLLRQVQRGSPGTAMPSFARLPDEDRAALAEYVRYLSLRGEVELYLLRLVVDEDEFLPLDRDWIMEDAVAPFWQLWHEAPEFVVVPPRRPRYGRPDALRASVERGRALYLSKPARCTDCHGPEGFGDGPQRPLYDDWTRPKIGVNPEQTARLAELYTLPPQVLEPRNFHRGVFRGGDRPLDLYWRIAVGIKGTPMPAGGPAPGVPGPLEPEAIWDLVNYVRSLGTRQFAARAERSESHR